MIDRGDILSTSQMHGALRVTQRVGVVIVACMTLALVGALAGLAVLADLPPLGRVLLAALAVLFLVLFGGLCWSSARQSRMALVVRTAGIEVRGAWRDHWIPWERVARIETSEHWYWRRATQIVTVDGERIIATVTSFQNALFRGEETDPSYRDHRLHQLPTRQAIDAHRRWLSAQWRR
ncbi:hypothetical protein [Brachybacterium sp. J153]|uniref:hypothetical protein n=1 Tax=Brachybacterium sp. J153 TaxID=3116488 RepID=UPI002E7667C5|nr:hypothetical protein [Brachybacterium sp. J153]MEE1617148.1 hypothetical protein [Brachybacterium sp. J153]